MAPLPPETAPGVNAFVLAGGRSRRMPSDKALLDWHGRPLLAHVVHTLAPRFGHVFVVGRNATDYADVVNVPILADLHPDHGPLGGVVTALSHTDTNWNLVAACDMPWIQPDVLALMLSQRRAGVIAVVPEVRGWFTPTLTLYHRDSLPALVEQLEQGTLSLQHLLKSHPICVVDEPRLRQVDPDLKSFVNLNTLDAWRRAAAAENVGAENADRE